MPSWARRFFLQWQALFKRERIAGQLDEEIQFHLEQQIAENIAAGMSPQQARQAALRSFGNPTLLKEDTLQSWGWIWLEQFLRDLRYGARSLRKSPSFSAIAILTLALGIGANTAIFSAVDALLLRPLPFSSPDQLVRIYSLQNGMSNTFGNPDGPSVPDVQDFARRSHSFQKMVVYDTWRKNVSLGDPLGQPEQRRVGLVPAAYFEVLDIHPIIGRLFTDAENEEGRNFVAAISAQLWKNRFAADPNILGRSLPLR
jgi:MacB-like periplasmic core domain